jgi:hypothetical protein
MKITLSRILQRKAGLLFLSLSLALAAGFSMPLIADETCMSPYMAKITGQEDFVYVWTLGAEGVGDEQDKLVTVDVNPASPNYGKVVHTLSVGGRNEAHHSGFTDDRHYLWAGGLDTSKIFIFDVHSDPASCPMTRTTAAGPPWLNTPIPAIMWRPIGCLRTKISAAPLNPVILQTAMATMSAPCPGAT